MDGGWGEWKHGEGRGTMHICVLVCVSGFYLCEGRELMCWVSLGLYDGFGGENESVSVAVSHDVLGVK